MNTYLLVFCVALFTSLALTPIVRRVCQRMNWVDVPQDDRRVHTLPIPRLGGVAVFASVLVAFAVLPFADTLVTQTFRATNTELVIILIPATLMLFFGIYDDLRGASAAKKFLAQGCAGLLLYWMGGRIDSFSLPFIGLIDPHWTIDMLVTVVWTIGVTNAFNLIDGVDGLATGAALFASLVMLVVSLLNGDPFTIIIAVALAGSLTGFLRYNFNPASIFLGDSGSLFIGFTLAALSILGMQKATTTAAVTIPLLAFGMPFVDTAFSMVRRFIAGRPIFTGDRDHIHHKLLERGWSQRRTVLVLYAVCAVFSIVSLLSVGGVGRATGFVLTVVGVAVALAINGLRYHEIDELKASMKRNVIDRRLRAANNIRVRRASHLMAKAETLAGLLAAVRVSLETEEFACARVQLLDGASGDICETLLTVGRVNTIDGKDVDIKDARLEDGAICWSWQREGFSAKEMLASGRHWSLRMPLVTEHTCWGYINLYRPFGEDSVQTDIGYLCTLYEHEMARAVERVMHSAAHERVTRKDKRPLDFRVVSSG